MKFLLPIYIWPIFPLLTLREDLRGGEDRGPVRHGGPVPLFRPGRDAAGAGGGHGAEGEGGPERPGPRGGPGEIGEAEAGGHPQLLRRREIPHFALHRRKFHTLVLRGVRNVCEAP